MMWERQEWMAVPHLLHALGWSAIGVLGIVALLFWTTWIVWLGNHPVLVGRLPSSEVLHAQLFFHNPLPPNLPCCVRETNEHPIGAITIIQSI
jgi:hypothetical protein